MKGWTTIEGLKRMNRPEVLGWADLLEAMVEGEEEAAAKAERAAK